MILFCAIVWLAARLALLLVHDAHAGGKATDGFFSLVLYPPQEIAALPRRPLDVIFIVDDGGTAAGAATQVKIALDSLLGPLKPEGTFRIFRGGEALPGDVRPLSATPEHVQQAVSEFGTNRQGGNPDVLGTLRGVLGLPPDLQRTRFVVLLTGGGTHSTEITFDLRSRLANTRLLGVGLGAVPDRAFLENLGRAAGAGSAIIYLDPAAPPTPPDAALGTYMERISHPALTDITIDFGGMQVHDVFPSTPRQSLADLYVGRPITLTGRFTGPWPNTVTVQGRSGERPVTFTVQRTAADCPVLPLIWARLQLADFYNRAATEPGPWPDRIRGVAQAFGLLSPYTAFLAVDAMPRNTHTP